VIEPVIAATLRPPHRPRALLLYNPNAASTNATARDRIVAILGDGVDLEVQPTKQRGHATHVAAGAVHEGLDAVFVLGGDGTTNEVLQSLATTDVCLGHIPGGGANVFARSLGLPTDQQEAARRIRDALLEGRHRPISLGRAGERWFGFSAGLGFDAAVVRRIEQRPRRKRLLGDVAFVDQAVREWFAGGVGPQPAIRVHGTGGQARGPYGIAMVANADPYTYLGPRPMRVTPDASHDRGLDLLCVGPVTTARILRIIAETFGRAGHARFPEVDYWRDLDRFDLVADSPLPLMVDGDYAGEHQQVTFSAHLGALKALC